MNKGYLWAFLMGLAFCSLSVADVVINEMDYDPINRDNDPGAFREFLELYNPGPQSVDLSGYRFTNGLTYEFPAGTTLAADRYLVLARVPTHTIWRNKSYPVLGPFDGKLSNEGETIRLVRFDGTVVDQFKYSDQFPWPRGADGYGYTLERIAWDLPASDYHSWRTSTRTGGTPGARNSVVGTIPRPLLTGLDQIPKHPTSADPITIQVGLDSPDIIESVTLRVERTLAQTQQNTLVANTDTWKYKKGTEAPSAGLEWTQHQFDDSAWTSGKGGFGYSDEEIETRHLSTFLNDMNGAYSTLFLRKTFTVEDPSTLGSLILSIYIDDGFACFLNGQKVASFNVSDSFTHTTLAQNSDDYDEPRTYELGNAASLLQPGENVLAIVGFNVHLQGSTDFVLAPTLLSNNVIGGSGNLLPMRSVAQAVDSATFEATLSPTASQSLVRYNVQVQLKTGQTLLLPHVGERRPFESFFVYDNEIGSSLPLYWIFADKATALPEIAGPYTALVTLHPLGTGPQVFDGVNLIRSENGNKIRFLKGEEFRGDRTINIIPETPTSGGSAGATAPAREYLGFWFYRHMGLIAPRAEFVRMIENPGESTERHTQRLVVQQINEAFLAMNSRDPDSDLYKLEHDKGFMKHTNLDEGMDSITNLLNTLNQAQRSQARLYDAIYANLDVEEFLTYSVTSVLLSNWDGFFNNNWMVLNPPTEEGQNGLWEIIPWDLDKTWGDTDTNQQFYEMPVDFPLYGQAAHAARAPGPITGPFHRCEVLHEEYKVRLRQQLDRQFPDQAPVFQEIGKLEQKLLDDISLMEVYTGKASTRLREQVTYSWFRLREFIQLRRGYLDALLPEGTPVQEWALY
ncbi:MAG: CotH kinase family protein [bacterium]|nr:CotH kinase family protein [bacterium]